MRKSNIKTKRALAKVYFTCAPLGLKKDWSNGWQCCKCLAWMREIDLNCFICKHTRCVEIIGIEDGILR